MSGAEQLLRLAQETGLGAFLVFLRIGAASALLPGFGEHSIPPRLRLMIAFAFTAITYPSLAKDGFPAELGPGYLSGEIAIGLILGLSLRMTVMVLQVAGTMIAQSVSLSQVFASAGSEPVTVIGEFLVLGGLALAVTLQLHFEIVRCLIESYRGFPPGAIPASGEALSWLGTRAAAVMSFALSLAMPFVAGALIYNVALGIINKAMPQLMVAMVGAPALTLGGLGMLMLCAPLILSTWIRHLNDILANPL